MIIKQWSNSYETSDGKTFQLLSDARVHEVGLLLKQDEINELVFDSTQLQFIALTIVLNGPAIAEILKEEV
jgi:hypothetical protein